MIRKTVLINTMDKVRDFNNIASKYDYDIDMINGRYIVDAKSIMGLFSIDLTKPIEMNVYSDKPDAFLKEIHLYLIENEDKNEVA